jgi:hypothetical protein
MTTRIVTSTYRYKRPPPKRKAQAAKIPQTGVKARKPGRLGRQQ